MTPPTPEPPDGDSAPDTPGRPAGSRRPSLAERKAAARARARRDAGRAKSDQVDSPADSSRRAGATAESSDPSSSDESRAKNSATQSGGEGAAPETSDAPPAKDPRDKAAPAGLTSRQKPDADPFERRSAPRTIPGRKDSSQGENTPLLDLADQTPSPRLRAATALLALGALALAAGAIAPVSPDAGPGYLSWPLLVILAVVPAGIAFAAARSGRHGLAAGLVTGLAALAPGRLILDLQFLVNGSKTIRPELYLPDRLLDRSGVGIGFWLLIAGHLLTLVAGIVAAQVVRERNEIAGGDDKRRWRLIIPLLAVVAAVGLLMTPVLSDDPFLLARSAFEGPGLALAGYLLLAGALPVAAVLGVSAGSDGVARGTLGGIVAAVLAVAVPTFVAGLAVSGLGVSTGAYLAVVPMALVLVLTPLATPQQTQTERTDLAGEARVPGLTMWRALTALLALLTGIAAAIGAYAPQLGNSTDSPARLQLLIAAVLVVLPTPFLLASRTASFARGVLAVLWAGVVLAGTAVLSTAITASEATGLGGLGGAISYHLGAGAVFTAIALGLAGLTGLAAVVTGVVERDDTGTEGPRSRVLLPAGITAVLAIATFGTPVFTAQDYAPPGLWSDFDTPSWGLLAAVLVVLGTLGLSVRSRPGAAAAGLTGAAVLLALHVAEIPLVSSLFSTAKPGLGFWLGLAATAAAVVAAVTAAAGAKK
ncbi:MULTISPECIES: hypothetical protein [Amycolatopsis]|uniref:Integral membrane protein n=1 Tax=Amycolatopsis albidoflavus TaxID=102226 RepID=A0ABW5HX56_9PSEU